MFHLILGVQKNEKKSDLIYFFSSLGINEHDLYWLRSSRNIVIDDFKRLKALERPDLRGKKLKNLKKISKIYVFYVFFERSCEVKSYH